MLIDILPPTRTHLRNSLLIRGILPLWYDKPVTLLLLLANQLIEHSK